MDTRPSKIRSRRSIHSQRRLSSDISQSDHNAGSGEENSSLSETSEEERNKTSHKDYRDKTKKCPKNQQDIFYYYILYAFLGFILLYVPSIWYDGGEVQAESPVFNIEELKKQFPLQEDDFWLNIKVAVNEIVTSNQPKSIIFVHTNEKNVNTILQAVSEYASSKILYNLSDPIKYKGEDLNRHDILEDYGVFITEIKEKLRDKAVVIVKNVNRVPAIAAQAFHSLCDEYNPIQERVLFLFTLKTVSFSKDSHFVENKLRKDWSDLHNDKFYPLYTRLSTFVLQIH